METKIKVRRARISDYDGLIDLWNGNGIKTRMGDDRRGMTRLFARNPGLSLVAVKNGNVIGAVMGTWDGRRGWLHHLAVDGRHRREHVASALVSKAESIMRKRGIGMVKVEIYDSNLVSRRFFNEMGYKPYIKMSTYSKVIGPGKA